MQTITLPKKKINLLEFTHRPANEDDYEKLLTEEFKIVDESTGKVVALYCKPKDELGLMGEVFGACSRTKFQTSHRTNGLKSTSRIFGYNPRNAIRKDFCSLTSYGVEQPVEHAKIIQGGAIAAKYYALNNPELYESHLSSTKEKVVDDFRLPEVPFTSGIINENNPLCYHFDSGNFKDVWSAMMVFKDGISGGYLSMPEYGVACEVAHNSIFYFDGQSILHGVTPIKRLNPNAKRFSIVYYSLRGMWNCQPLIEEIARARMRREAVESNRLSKGKAKKP